MYLRIVVIKKLFSFREGSSERIQLLHNLSPNPSFSKLQPSNNTIPDILIMIIVKLIKSIEDSHSFLVSVDSNLASDNILNKVMFEMSIPKLMLKFFGVWVF